MDSKEGDEPSSPDTQTTQKGKVQSYAHIHGEWEQRKPSLLGAVKSFVSQLQKGQDLTRVSLPCVFLRPYSLLEEVAARQLSHIDILFSVLEQEDPLMRFLGVARWLISTARQEEYRHKPFNPVIGEVHRCKVVHDPKKPENTTYMVLEQVEHHPPTCAIRLDNPHQKIWIESFITFKADMYTNSVQITNVGQMNIGIGEEVYFLPKPMPDVLVKNVIMGSKLVVWEGNIEIICKKSGYRGGCQLTTKGKVNVCDGQAFDTIDSTDKDEPLVIVEGKCGGPANWHYNSKHKRFANIKEKKEKKDLEKDKELCDEEKTRPVLMPEYPETQEANSSITIWEPVRRCIIDNNMEQGDIEKQKIENGQRSVFMGLKEKGENWKAAYFVCEDGKWKIVKPDWYKDYKD